MLQTGFTFLFSRYSWLKGVKFIDASFVECTINRHNESKIENLPLHSFELAKYGQTWYQKNFGAYPESIKDATAIAKLPALLETNFTLHKNSYYEFFKKYIKHQAVELEALQLELLQKTFEKSRTFSSWIKRVVKTPHLQCGALLEWLNLYIYKLVDVNMSNTFWIIEKTARIKILWKQIDGDTISIKRKALLGGGHFVFSKSRPRQLLL